MIRKATKTALLSAAVLSGACVAQAASAALITDFDYTVDSSFSSFTGTGGLGTIDPSGSGYNGDPTTLSWGTNRAGTAISNPQSSISITPSMDGHIVTNGAAAPGATFSHDNRVIPDTSNTLNTFNLATKLNLTATAPASEAGTTPAVAPIMFNSSFSETPNDGTCPAGGTSGNYCNDIFVLTNGENANPPPQTFTHDGILYTVMLDIMGIDTLSDSACDAAGAGAGCVGFVTNEARNNAFSTTFTITAAQQAAVPEPGNLAMLAVGLGLIGFGFYARRRNFRA